MKIEIPIPPCYHTHELSHKYAGNGWCFLHRIDDTYVRVCHKPMQKDPKEKKLVPTRLEVKTARMDMLEKFTTTNTDPDTKEKTITEYPISQDGLAQIKELREDLELGKRKVVNGFVVAGK
jgi:hypothetical protein